MHISTFLKSYWKSLLVLAGILYLSFASPSTFKGIPRFIHADKITHFIMFLVFTLILIYDFCKSNRKNTGKMLFLIICFVFPILLGGFIEIMQETFFQPRSADWFDWLADITGTVLALMIMYFTGWTNKITNSSTKS